MSMKVAERGVAVHEVRVHLLESPHLLFSAPDSVHQTPTVHPQASMPHPTIALPLLSQNEGQVVEGSVQQVTMDSPSLYPDSPLGMAGPLLPPIHPAGSPVAPPPRVMGTPAAGAPQQPLSLLSAQALSETYDAVVRNRISDITTIQRIISQFEAVLADPELREHVPFDAAAGVRNLRTHLHNLQMRNLAQLGQQQQNDTSLPPNSSSGQEDRQ
jgi:hypothetical protein